MGGLEKRSIRANILLQAKEFYDFKRNSNNSVGSKMCRSISISKIGLQLEQNQQWVVFKFGFPDLFFGFSY